MLKLYFPSASPYRDYSSQSHCLLRDGFPGLFFQQCNTGIVKGWPMFKFLIFRNLVSLEIRLRLTYLAEVHHIITFFHSVFGMDYKWKICIEIYIVEGTRCLLTV